MSSEISVTATLSIKTCYCGTVFAVPNWIGSDYVCPTCAYRDRNNKNEQEDKLLDEISTLKRANRALRGYIRRKD